MDIAAAAADLVLGDQWRCGDCGRIAVHGHVHHPYGGPARRGQHVHCRTSAEKVGHHLLGDLAGISGYALRGNAVVCGENHDLWPDECMWWAHSLTRGRPYA